MKSPREAGRLARHRPQAWEYWYNSADPANGRAAVRYVVLCAFHRFEIWEPGKFPREPRLTLSLDELPDQYEALLFLADDEPLFRPASRRMTEAAATAMAGVYRHMLERDPQSRAAIQRFMTGVVWNLFVDREFTTALLDQAAKRAGRVYWPLWNLLGAIDEDLAVEGGNLQPVALGRDSAERLQDAAQYNWRSVDPTIFGSLMEGFLGAEARGALGAYYTHEADILRIVRPTIVRPWRERIAAAGSVEEALLLFGELRRFRVLDPACGCGNFLYVAYRELGELANALSQRIIELAGEAGWRNPASVVPCLPLWNMHGFDREVVAARIARMTLRIGHWQMYGPKEPDGPPPPLIELPTIQAKDALAEPWPEVDCIVGNPPFLGSQHMRHAFGGDYLAWLRKEFGIGVKDYCVYWFRRAHDNLKPGQRAGLVGTNSIAQNRARPVSLDYIVATGGVITDAVSSQDWPGSAAVDVCLVNWVKAPDRRPTAFVLDGTPVPGITADLRTPETSTAGAKPLPANQGRCFQGMSPVGDGFIISAELAATLLTSTEANYREVVRPYLVGEDIAESPWQQPRRWIIDFGVRTLEAAMRYPAALAVVRERVKPLREANNDRFRKEHWWLFGRPYTAIRSALDGLPRYLAAGRVGKRLLFAWCEPWTCPSDLVYVFAFPDDYSMGLLSSFLHEAWVRSRPSTLEDRLRYTPTSAFLPFPWPYPVDGELRTWVAEAGRRVIVRRQEICVAEGFGLTRLYNLMDEGAYPDLKKLHRDLDEAAVVCYGWPRSVARDGAEIARRLLRLNHEIAAGDRPYDPFSAGAAEPATPLFRLEAA